MFNNTLTIKSTWGFCFAIKNKITPDDNVKNFARCPDYFRMEKMCLHFRILNLRTMLRFCEIFQVKVNDASMRNLGFSSCINLNYISLTIMFILIKSHQKVIWKQWIETDYSDSDPSSERIAHVFSKSIII